MSTGKGVKNMSFRNKMVAVSLAVSLASAASGAVQALAQMSHEGHGLSYPPVSPQGVLIRESTVQGRKFGYRLYSWAERNVMMKGMEGHQMAGMDSSGRSTHHLMLFAFGADGKELSGGKVGFIITGPDASEFKTLTMAMTGGYGADVPFGAKGAYTVKTKAVFGDATLTEEFMHTVK